MGEVTSDGGGGAGWLEVKLEEKPLDDAEFIVLEDDGEEDDGIEKLDTSQGGPEDEEKAEAESVNMDVDKTSEDHSDKTVKSEVTLEGKEVAAEVILVNPLFGKDSVPVIDVDDDSSSGSEDDFSGDVQANGLHEGTDCGRGCRQEKGILIAENKRLRNAIRELGNRQSVLEDFIQVEYADKFQTFLKNRDRLMSMGFGTGDSDSVDGKRSAKSTELVELLSMSKEQADTGAKEDKCDSQSKSTPAASGNAGGSGSAKPAGSSSSQNESLRFLAFHNAKMGGKKKAPNTEPDLASKKKCPLCPAVTQGTKLEEHLINQHCPANAKMMCPSCSDDFSWKPQLKTHLSRVHQYSQNDCLMITKQCYASMSETLKPWVLRMTHQAKIPTKNQYKLWKAHVNSSNSRRRR